MRLRTPLFALLTAGLVGLLAGCGKKPPAEPGAKAGPDAPAAKPNPNPDVGGSLYPFVAAPTYPTVVSRNADVIISNALGQYDKRQIISAEVDGTIDQIATPVQPGEAVPPDQVVYLRHDPAGAKTQLRELRDGVEVKDGQALVFMDARQIIAKTQGAEKVRVSAEAALAAAAKGKKDALDQLKLVQQGGAAGVQARKEEIEASLAYNRYVENEAQSAQTIARAEADIAEGRVLLARHTVLCRFNGFIRSVTKRPGEYVKAGEKIMEIEVTDKIRIEGQLDVQYAQYAEDAMKRGLTVNIERAAASAQVAGHTGHRQPVTGVAVVGVTLGDKEVIPLVVSVGADGAALVWDPNLGKQTNRPAVPHNLPHPVGVRSVAATPMTTKAALVVTGGDDGRVRIWNVSNPAKLPDKPQAEPEDAHTTAVNSIAVSPKGDFFATAAGRDVFVWDLAGAKKRYALPVEHRDNVTAVSFTPQSTLVTASKDGTIKVWKLGTDRAAAVRTLDHRAGAVEAPGVSRDGARLLFDQDKTRIDLVDPANGQTVGQLQNVSSAGSFSTLAAFGPDEIAPNTPPDQLPPYHVVTAGGDGDLKGTLQFWHAPRTGGRGAEKGRLITPGRAAVTAAAFSPIRNQPFVAVGTAAGGVCLWKPPADNQEAYKGKIVNIDATDTRYVTVRVELDNKKHGLPDKSTFTVILSDGGADAAKTP